MANHRKFTDTEKWCPGCKKWLLLEKFHRRNDGRGGGYVCRCKECLKAARKPIPLTEHSRAHRKKWWQENKWRYKRPSGSHREYRYGITSEVFKKMCEEQNGKCAILSCPNPAAFLDHSHETGENRAVLCRFCNFGLGFFRDSPQRLREAAEYLEKYIGKLDYIAPKCG